ncbi:MAG: ABC transporter substrate-binding protein [Solirubrobacteraceae bacterium]
MVFRANQDVHVYPLTPDLGKARQLARGHTGATAVLYTCDVTPCPQQAQIITADLAAIGIHVETKAFSLATLFTEAATPGAPFDIACGAWTTDYPDPDDFLNLLLESGTQLPTPPGRGRPQEAGRSSSAHRATALPHLRETRSRDRARCRPLDRLRQPTRARILLGPRRLPDLRLYGLDLADLCIRHPTR